MFCAQAGAAKVIAVDQSDIIYYAMDIVRWVYFINLFGVLNHYLFLGPMEWRI